MRKITMVYLGRRGAGNTYSIEMAKSILEAGVYLQCVLSNQIENSESWNQLKLNYPQLTIAYINTYSDKWSFIYKLILGWLKYSEVRKMIDRYSPDFIYIPMLSLLTVYVIGKKYPLVTTVHDVEQHAGEKNFLVRMLYDMVIRQSKKIIVLSKKFTSLIQEKYKFNAQNVFVIPHAIFSSYVPTSYVPDFKIKKRILFFGRIHSYKGLSLLLKALSIVIKEMPDIQLRIAGDGKLSQEELDLIDKLSPYLDLHLEWIPDNKVSMYFNDIDMVILPYIEASQSGVIPLSYSLGKMVIVSDVGGLSEQIIENCGILLPPNDYKTLACTILECYRNPNNIVKYNKKAYEIACKDLTWEYSANLLLTNTKDL